VPLPRPLRLVRRSLAVVALAGVAACWPFRVGHSCDVGDAIAEARTSRVVHDAAGRIVTSLDLDRGRYRALADLPPWVPDAFIAVEDRRFRAWYHVGVDPLGVLGAIRDNLVDGRRRGASTLAMQLSRALCGRAMPAERSIRGKLAETTMGIWLTRSLGREEVLELYLNTVYLGRNRRGVDAGALAYFGVPATKLRAPDAAELAHLVAAPRPRDPARASAAARQATVRRVFARMRRLDARWARLPDAMRPSAVSAAPRMPGPDAALVAMLDRRELIGDRRVVRTTLSATLQRAAAREVTALVRAHGGTTRDVAALFVARRVHDGAVLAWAAAASRRDPSLFTMARIRPASTLKPLLLAAALRGGTDLGTVDVYSILEGHCPELAATPYLQSLSGWEAPFRTLADALARSDNVLGPCLLDGLRRDERESLHDAGLLVRADAPHVSGLGTDAVPPLALLDAYAQLAAAGDVRVSRFGEDDVDRRAARFADDDALASVRDALALVPRAGTAWRVGAALPGQRLFGKTGTAERGREMLYVGGAGDVVALLWLGALAGDRPVAPGDAGTVAAPAWARVMRALPR
jgi:penicillin-binding protein 1A